MSVQDVRLISLTPLAGSRGRVATTLARAIGDNDLLIMLSGPDGSGKSAILAAVVATLAYGGMRVIRVSNPDDSTMGQRELAARILGRPTMGSPAQLVAEAITNLLATTDDGQVVLVVDDAHTLSDQALELLLVITSPARRGGRAPQLLLAGRGAYWERPWRDELRMLTDVAEKIILDALTTDDARDFVMDEAKASGGTVADVTSDALSALVRCSSGLCAQMDRIVTSAVALGNSRRATVLTEEIVDAVVTPDTLLEPPCAVATPHSGGDATPAKPTTEVHAPAARRKLPGGWPAIAATALVVVAGASIALMPALRTQISSLTGRSAPVAPPEPASTPANEAATETAPPQVTQAEQTQPADQVVVVAGSTTTSTTPTVASAATGASPNAPVSPPAPNVGPVLSVEPNSEPSAAARDLGHPPASSSANRPVAPTSQTATPADHSGSTTSPTDDSHGGDQQTVPHSAPADSTTETQATTPVRVPETAKPETTAVPHMAPQASVTPTAGPTQSTAVAPISAPPTAAPPATPMPIAPLPNAPPPSARLPITAPPAATPSATQPLPAAPPSVPASQEAASLPPSAIAILLQHGNEKLALGDILSARLYFERAGAAGSEAGAMGAARTYDPGYLATIDAPGLRANVKQAIDWYRIAVATHGNSEAQNRIDALTAAGAR